MSLRQRTAIRATALQVASRLARYERHMRRLVATWLDMDLYDAVSEEIDEIRDGCAVLPDLASASAALVLSHSDLVHTLLRTAQQEAPDAKAQRERQLREHLACIDALARRCLRVSADAAAPAA